MVEDLLAERRIIVSHQTIRMWSEKFGRQFSADIRLRSAGQFDGKWHLSDVVIFMRGKKHLLWRTVDQDGFALDVVVQSHSNASVAKRLMRKLLKRQGLVPRVMITDKLRSYGAAKREIMPSVKLRSHKGMNSQAENSHQPTQPRVMKRLKSPRQLQRFVSIHDPVASLFNLPRHEMTSTDFRDMRSLAMQTWHEIALVSAV